MGRGWNSHGIPFRRFRRAAQRALPRLRSIAVAAKELAKPITAITPGPLLLRYKSVILKGTKKKTEHTWQRPCFANNKSVYHNYMFEYITIMQHLISSDHIEIIPSPDTCKLGVSVP